MTPARPITDVFPRPIAVTLGGEEFLVGELRLGEIATVQAWLDLACDPLAAVRPYLFAAEVPPEHRHLFEEAAELVDAGPVVWGDERAWAMLATGEGLFAFLRAVLGRHHGYLTDGRVIDLMGRMTPEEYAAVRRAAHRPDPEELLGRALDRLSGVTLPDEPAPPPRWGEWVDRVSRSHGMSYERIERLTVGQLVNRLNEGKGPAGGGRPIPRGEDVEATAAKRAAWLSGGA